MNVDTAGNPVYHYDMCSICNVNTAGQHESHCPLYQGPVQIITPLQSVTIKMPPEGWNGNPKGLSYADWGKEMEALIDAHPEWGIECL